MYSGATIASNRRRGTPPSDVTWLASYSGVMEGAVSTGSGALVTKTGTYWNESGAPITHLSAAFFWNPMAENSDGVALVEAYTVQATFAYLGLSPQNFTLSASNDIPSDSASNHTFTDIIELATPIPAGAAVAISVTSTVGSGIDYNPNMLGFAGLMTTAPSNTIRRPVGYGGDSLFNSVNHFPVEYVARGRFPSVNFAKGGTRSTTWGTGTRFARQAAFMAAVGVTDFICDWSINDVLDGTSAAATMTALQSIESQVGAQGISHWQTTQSARGIDNPITAVSVTASTDTLDVVVADASAFRVNDIVKVVGATGTGASDVNGLKLIEAIVSNTLTMPFRNQSAISGAVSGTITLENNNVVSTLALQQSYTAREDIRGPLNASIRSYSWSGGYIEIGDRTESSRDSGKKAVGGSQPEFQEPTEFVAGAGTGTGTVVIPEATFTVQYDDLPPSNAFIAFKSGNARGLVGVCNTGFTDLQSVPISPSFAVAPASGDTAVVFPRGYYASEPAEIHPAGTSGATEKDGAGIWVNAIRDAVVTMGYTAYGLPSISGTGFVDHFDRAEEPLSTSSNWTLVSGSARYARVYRRRMYSAWSNTGTSRVTLQSPDMGSADHWAEIVYGGGGGSANNIVALRLTSNANFIGMHWTGAGTITIIKRVSGSNTTLATFTLSAALQRGDRMRFGILGSDVTVWLNGTSLVPTTGSLTGLTSLPTSTTRQGVVLGGGRSEVCWRYATGLM